MTLSEKGIGTLSMIRFAAPFLGLALAAVMIPVAVSPVAAQDGRALDARENPFLPTTTEEEDRRIADRERMRQVFREMLPEVKSIAQGEIAAARQQIVDEAKRQAVETVKSDPGIVAAQAAAAAGGAGVVSGVPQAAAAAAPAPIVEREGFRSRLPEGAKFVACVNRKALYRDAKDGMNFFYEPPRGGGSTCD